MVISAEIKGKDQKTILLFALIIFFIFSFYYAAILYLRIDTDVQIHALVAWSFFSNHDNLSPNFLYYFLVVLFAGFSKYKAAYYVASITVLSLAIAAKFLVNIVYIKKHVTGIKQLQAIVLSVSMLFIFCLPNNDFFRNKVFYLGQLAPNVWHNSTAIFLFPFAILLFFKCYELLYSGKSSRNLGWQIIFLILLNALIKPSFLFTIIPSVFIIFFVKLFAGKYKVRDFSMLVPFAAGICFIMIEYFIIYQLNYSSTIMSTADNSKVVFAPFKVWSHFSHNIPFSIITSCFFPLIYILFSKGEVFKNKLVLFSALNFLIGVSIWSLFAESGFREFHGNFYWQVVITNYLLFFTLLLHFINNIRANRLSNMQRFIIGGAYMIHLLWGIFYWLKIIIFKGYS